MTDLHKLIADLYALQVTPEDQPKQDALAKDLERALSAQGEAVAWQVNAVISGWGWENCSKSKYDETVRTGRYLGLPTGTTDVEVRALYTHPAPARVTEEMARALIYALAEVGLLNNRPRVYDDDIAAATSALTATLEDGRHG